MKDLSLMGYRTPGGDVNDFVDLAQRTRELMEMHPYECFCGAGLTTAKDCVYCQTYEQVANLLERCGFPLLFRRGTMDPKEK